LGQAFLNTIIMAVPSTIIPIFLAALAAYGFAWMSFPGRKLLFMILVALLVIPLQMSLIPILRDYRTLGLNGTFLGVWLANTGFGLSLATYLLYNYIVTLPREVFESAVVDGASHPVMFTKLVVPLSVPAFASFAIFQFLWVWNGILIPLVFLGDKPGLVVLPQRILQMLGTYAANWTVTTAGAFVSMALPLFIFIAFQRYFVRGMMAGSVKG
jgi:alpha-glucoside transport system permease protein